jgi:hypothetical protein
MRGIKAAVLPRPPRPRRHKQWASTTFFSGFIPGGEKPAGSDVEPVGRQATSTSSPPSGYFDKPPSGHLGPLRQVAPLTGGPVDKPPGQSLAGLASCLGHASLPAFSFPLFKLSVSPPGCTSPPASCRLGGGALPLPGGRERPRLSPASRRPRVARCVFLYIDSALARPTPLGRPGARDQASLSRGSLSDVKCIQIQIQIKSNQTIQIN